MKKQSPTLEKLFESYQEHLSELNDLVKMAKSKERDESLDRQLVEGFNATHDLAIALFQEFFKKSGRKPFSGSRDATIEAFNEDLIDDGALWLEMIIDRIKYVPLYPEDYQGQLLQHIQNKFMSALRNFERKMKAHIE
jgi:hypothetical protein